MRLTSNRRLVIIVDDQNQTGNRLEEAFRGAGYEAVAVAGPEEAMAASQVMWPVLVVADWRLAHSGGADLPGFFRSASPPAAFLAVMDSGQLGQAVQALELGADDFITEPWSVSQLLLRARCLLEQGGAGRSDAVLAGEEAEFHGLLGRGPAMQSLFAQVRQVAQSEASVLLLGESGVGKELVARAVHAESHRKDGPFVAVNCAGIPLELLESEFFGHRSGAFTGAHRSRAGLFAEAHGGTLLLDEVGEMPAPLQAKLLRVLQEGRIKPLGEDREYAVDVRVLAATNRDLGAMVEEDHFRRDLFYRLETLQIRVPALRERAEDIELLARYFLDSAARRAGKAPIVLDQGASEALRRYPFPGNVRELANAMERAATFCTGRRLRREHLPPRMGGREAPEHPGTVNIGGEQAPPPEGWPSLAEVQRRYIDQVLRQVGGNKRRAARVLGIDRRTLYRWLERDEFARKGSHFEEIKGV